MIHRSYRAGVEPCADASTRHGGVEQFEDSCTDDASLPGKQALNSTTERVPASKCDDLHRVNSLPLAPHTGSQKSEGPPCATRPQNVTERGPLWSSLWRETLMAPRILMFILYSLFPSWRRKSTSQNHTSQVLSAEFTDCGAELNAGGQTKRRMRARQILTGRHDIDAMNRDVGNRFEFFAKRRAKTAPCAFKPTPIRV
ncbi:hypothetical protein CISG_02294 [Coccidioides immitis RMSCC 3703]|uniref:Uncharacterized protein n=2 Tax=Coccidioides immitis TaxID=5501 RepID=A0A0J8R9G6_COCIT|nr:hypothetical protein CIRG_06035 [Coccidioides immitis RMSCC 2394]KMU80443.1 hypothetical protein CISG_02294 [Coccidioides immitis RMSCC 3703]